jgi:cell wall-associated NlpC family hydrolase
MATSKKIIEKAREYIGTPFRHQGRLKGVGVDCAGLVVGVAKELKISDFDFRAYGAMPNSSKLQIILNEQMDKINVSDAKIGDVYLMKFDKEPQHLGIKTDIGIIHSYSDAGAVVEHRIDEIWQSRILGAYRFKKVK